METKNNICLEEEISKLERVQSVITILQIATEQGNAKEHADAIENTLYELELDIDQITNNLRNIYENGMQSESQ